MMKTTPILLSGLAALSLSACDDGNECQPGSGEICTIAGTGIAGYSGEGEKALNTHLYLPQDLTVGPDGLLYVVDWNNHRIRVIHEDDTMETVVGSGYIGDGLPGVAKEADLNHPTNVIFDGSGRMVFAAWHNSQVKRVDLTSGMIENMCGTGARAYSGEGGKAGVAALDLPSSLAYDGDGNLFIMDQANQIIRKVDPAGNISRVAGQCIIETVDNRCEEGEVPVACPNTDKKTCIMDEVLESGQDPVEACNKPCFPTFGGDEGPALEARLGQPFGQAAAPAGRITFDAEGRLVFADSLNHRIRRLEADGTIITLAGTGERGATGDNGPALEAKLNTPTDVEIASDGTIYFTDTQNSCVRAFTVGGNMRTVAGICGKRGFEGDGGSASEALLDRPYGIELDAEDNLYIVDTYNHRIRLVPR